MKKSYHSIVVPIVDAMTALRNCLLCSVADSLPCGVIPNVAVLAIVFPSGPSPWSSLSCLLSLVKQWCILCAKSRWIDQSQQSERQYSRCRPQHATIPFANRSEKEPK
jgi:hypothetical protein